MIIVRVELHSAITHKVTELAKVRIYNDGTSEDENIGHYNVEVLRKRGNGIMRKGRVEQYPRKSYHILRLVIKALRSAFPEEH